MRLGPACSAPGNPACVFIIAEITSTMRVGMHRWTFAKAGTADIMFDMLTPLNEAKPVGAYMKKVNGKQLEGWLKTNIGYKTFFVAQFDAEMKEFRGWKNPDLGVVPEVSAYPVVGYPRFQVSANQVIQMKVALSYCSIDQAKSNLAIELDHWNFDKVRRESRRQWNELLDNVEVTGGTNDQKKRFYTDVWHTLLGRSTCSDANGEYPDYMGSSLAIRELPKQNIAPLATITTSSELDDAHAAMNVVDGVIGKQSEEWVSRTVRPIRSPTQGTTSAAVLDERYAWSSPRDKNCGERGTLQRK